MSRIYEKDTDAVLIRRLRSDLRFAAAFADAAQRTGDSIVRVRGQTKHLGASGTVDIELLFASNFRLFVENKIDAGYSITRLGDGQPDRYRRTVAQCRNAGEAAASLLVAPSRYLLASRFSSAFDFRLEYETLVPFLEGADRGLIETAILQAETPYEPVPNMRTGDFFGAYRSLVLDRFPDLHVKPDPNSNGIRPDHSRTIYFDVKRTLTDHAGVPRPRMSLQCWDKDARAASVKIMIGGWGRLHTIFPRHPSLDDVGAYLRPAGRSLGIVIDTPRLNTQRPLLGQIEAVVEGLEAALRLQGWWNSNSDVLREWNAVAEQQAQLDMRPGMAEHAIGLGG